MNSREIILESIRIYMPSAAVQIPVFDTSRFDSFDILKTYKRSLNSIGGDFVEVKNYEEVIDFVKKKFDQKKRLLTTIPELSQIAALNWIEDNPHTLEDVELMIVKAHFGVAENSALWVTDAIVGQRVSVFIPQYLAIVVNKKDIVPTMHEAYEEIGDQQYGFGTFIAGPSKTADIEQSLVLGAHGARGLTVFLME